MINQRPKEKKKTHKQNLWLSHDGTSYFYQAKFSYFVLISRIFSLAWYVITLSSEVSLGGCPADDVIS